MLMLVLRSLQHRKLRAASAMLSVAIACGMLVTALSVIRRLSEISEGAKASRILVMPAMSARLPLSYLARLRKLSPRDIEYYNGTSGTDGNRLNFGVWGASAGFPATYPPALYRPEPGAEERWRDDKQGILASHTLMEKMGWVEGQHVVVRTTMSDLPGTIDGINRGDLDNVIFHYEYLNQLLPADARDQVQRYSLSCEPSACLTLAAAIDAELESDSYPTNTMRQEAFFETLNNSIASIPRLFSQVAFVIVLITVIVGTNTLAIALRERRRELATLRVLGFTRARVIMLILSESIIVSVCGGLVGVGIPFLLYYPKGFRAGLLQLSHVLITPAMCGVALMASIILGLLIAIIPALLATRHPPLVGLASD